MNMKHTEKPSLLHRLRALPRRFGRREEGSMTIEAILALPFFIFATFGLFTYWDGYKVINAAQKAAYTVSDMVSRQQASIDEEFLDGMHDVMEYMLGPRLPVDMRFTAITFSEADDRYEVIWSYSPNNAMPALTTDSNDFLDLRDSIPELSDGGFLIAQESRVDYRPPLNATLPFFMFLEAQRFEQFIVTPPRFVPQICLGEDLNCGS